MATLREIKGRILSVKTTLKTTSAMKLVSSSKLRRAQLSIDAMLPYKVALEEILEKVLGRKALEDTVAPQQSDSPALIVAIASNSSLCGGFNVNAVKAVQAQLALFPGCKVISVGRKMADAMKRAGYVQNEDFSVLSGKPSYEDAAAFATRIIDSVKKGEYSKVLMIYNHAASPSKQVPVVESWMDSSTFSYNNYTEELDNYLFEPSRDTVIESLLPQILKQKFYTALLDSSAAEHAARTIAMQTASDNAQNMLSDLTLEYNKSRQQKITAELLDIMGGQG